MTSGTARENQSVTASAGMGVHPETEPLLSGDRGSGRDRRQAISRNPAGPTADHGARPGALRGAGRDEITLIVGGFGGIEVLGRAGPGWAAVTATIRNPGNRRVAAEDAQAIEGGRARWFA